MNNVTQLVVMAFLVEALWETLKMVWQQGKLSKDKVGALVSGLLISFTMGIDMFEAVGLKPSIPYIGIVATGVLISRGGNYIHDLINFVKKD